MTKQRDRIGDAGYSSRVAVRGDEVIRYSYVSVYRPRPGYRFTVENSIYISQTARRSGCEKLLLADLIKVCKAQGYRQMIAIVGDFENAMSIDFHLKMGFEHAGTIKTIGYKLDRWLDSVLMQLPLGDGSQTPPSDET